MQFALAILQFCRSLPRTPEGCHVRQQLFRAGTAVAANYRSACKGKSTADLVSKLGTVIEEADECEFWLAFSARAALVKEQGTTAVRGEADELTAIFTKGKKSAEARLAKEIAAAKEARKKAAPRKNG